MIAKSVGSFLIYLRCLIEFGRKVCFSSYNKTRYRRGDDFNESYIELKKTESVLNG